MKAIQVSEVGGPDALKLVELPVPEPKPNEVIVQLKASGVNFIDVYFREGRYPTPLPFVDGQEGAGIVIAVGADVTNVKGTGWPIPQCWAVMLSMLRYRRLVWSTFRTMSHLIWPQQ